MNQEEMKFLKYLVYEPIIKPIRIQLRTKQSRKFVNHLDEIFIHYYMHSLDYICV